MKVNRNREEKTMFSLRSLYEAYGYGQYKMSKFEEYDLYLRNKSFLVSDHIITFTDTNGKLMALKPDVTLSIVKNRKEDADSVQKLYYQENVYRVSEGTQSFKEIMQAGLECMGKVDDYMIYEVLMLAAESLRTVSEEYVLELSHLGVVSALVDAVTDSEEVRRELTDAIGAKNASALAAIEKREGLDCAELKKLIVTYGTLSEVLPFLETLSCREEVAQIRTVMTALEQNGYLGKVRLDFSLLGDLNYYNGFVFRGFLNGIPSAVLSGGQYDHLMKKMKKKDRAIGFAMYLDLLALLEEEEADYDVDIVILYEEGAAIGAITDAISLFSANGNTVTVQPSVPKKLRYRQLVRLTEKGVEILENHA